MKGYAIGVEACPCAAEWRVTWGGLSADGLGGIESGDLAGGVEDVEGLDADISQRRMIFEVRDDGAGQESLDRIGAFEEVDSTGFVASFIEDPGFPNQAGHGGDLLGDLIA